MLRVLMALDGRDDQEIAAEMKPPMKPQNLSAYRNGNRKLTDAVRARIAAALGVEPSLLKDDLPRSRLIDAMRRALKAYEVELASRPPLRLVPRIAPPNPTTLSRCIEIPLVRDRIAAGRPLLSEDNIEGYVAVDPRKVKIVKGREYFAAGVKGRSMEGNQIFEGDTVYVLMGEVPHDGDTVVATVFDETVIAVFERRGEQFWLTKRKNPDDPEDYPEILLTEHCAVNGVVMGVSTHRAVKRGKPKR